MCNLHFVMSLLLTTMHSVFLQLMFNPFFSLPFTTFSRSFCSFLSVSAVNTMPPSYLLLLRLWPSIMNPCRISNSLRIASLYRLNKSGEKTHPCLTPLSIFVYLLNSFSVYMQVVCCQHRFLIILISFPNRSRLLINSDRSLWRTSSNAFV